MKQKAPNPIHRLSDVTINFIKSRWFLVLLISVTVAQGIWYAVSFQPTIFDEGQHIGYIELYAERLNPFISEQEEQWDFLGDTTRNSSYLYYYLMSFPYRAVSFLTESSYVQIVVLRLINTLFFAGAIYIFDRLFRKMKNAVTAGRVSLLAVILTPSIAPLAGAVNYDNLMFLIVAIQSLHAYYIIHKKKPSLKSLVLFVSTAAVGTVVKWQYAAFAVPAVLFIAYELLKNKRIKRIDLDLFRSSRLMSSIVIIFSLISVGLFLERPVYNTLEHGSVTVACQRVLPVERCKENYSAKRNIEAQAARENSNFSPKPVLAYAFGDWTYGMTLTQTRIIPTNNAMPVMLFAFTAMFFIGTITVLIYLRDLLRQDRAVYFMVFVLILYVVVLFVRNYSAYRRYGVPVAVTSRYLLPVMPFFYFLVANSFKAYLKKFKGITVVIFITLLFVFSQGGGITTYSINAEERFYFNGQTIKTFNQGLKGLFQNFVIEGDSRFTPRLL